MCWTWHILAYQTWLLNFRNFTSCLNHIGSLKLAMLAEFTPWKTAYVTDKQLPQSMKSQLLNIYQDTIVLDSLWLMMTYQSLSNNQLFWFHPSPARAVNFILSIQLLWFCKFSFLLLLCSTNHTPTYHLPVMFLSSVSSWFLLSSVISSKPIVSIMQFFI